MARSRLRDLGVFLVLELFAIVWAGVVFAWIPSRLMAGMFAGGYFVALGVGMLAWISRRWSNPWRSILIYPLLVHLFGVSLPLMVTRLVNSDSPFENLTIWGIPGPEFHRVSTVVFTLLIVSTLADAMRAWRKPT